MMKKMWSLKIACRVVLKNIVSLWRQKKLE